MGPLRLEHAPRKKSLSSTLHHSYLCAIRGSSRKRSTLHSVLSCIHGPSFVVIRLYCAIPRLILQGPKFTKAFQTEDNDQKIFDFLSLEERTFLFCPESLKCETVMPRKVPKGKTVIFMKVLRGTVTSEGIAREVMVMELGGNTPFEHLELLAHEVFLPILSNAQNQSKWGEVPTREIMDRFYGFLSSTTILCGQIKGETRLPMPPMDIGGASSGKNRISLLEGAIITWTKQIKSVLKQDPESQLKQGMHPTPDVEIDFWKNKVNQGQTHRLDLGHSKNSAVQK